MPVRLHVAAFTDLDTATLYALLRLRVNVFVVEQNCPYPELDDRDTEPGTRHLWLADDGGAAEPMAYLRIIEDASGPRIGRVVTAPHRRGGGLAGRLLGAALERVGDRTVRLNAQVTATAVYERHGFTVDGAEFLEDGIPHLPMVRRPAGSR